MYKNGLYKVSVYCVLWLSFGEIRMEGFRKNVNHVLKKSITYKEYSVVCKICSYAYVGGI